jgi:cation transport protein ChaC
MITPPPLPRRGEPLYIFAYGSLMWNPEFPHRAQHVTRLEGWHRRFCIKSTMYRGTPEQPGLVLGLDEGGHCTGVVFEVGPDDANLTLQYLWGREMHTGIYEPRWLPMRAGGQIVKACAFTVRRDHPNYVDERDLAALARIIREARGQRGHNLEYLKNTVAELQQRGLEDAELRELLALADNP